MHRRVNVTLPEQTIRLLQVLASCHNLRLTMLHIAAEGSTRRNPGGTAFELASGKRSAGTPHRARYHQGGRAGRNKPRARFGWGTAPAPGASPCGPSEFCYTPVQFGRRVGGCRFGLLSGGHGGQRSETPTRAVWVDG